MGVPLFDVATLRAVEISAAKSLRPGALMQRAGAAAARQIAQRLGTPKTVAIVCGAGNNGGDGYACALELAQRGHRVECAALAPPATDDARAAADTWRASGGAVRDGIDRAAKYDAVVDAMFGIGLSRPLDGAFAAAAEWINAQRAGSRIALDVPSGLDADRGSWVGAKPGVTADQTITFIGAKPGLFTGAGCDASGEVLVESIGVELPNSPLILADRADFASVCRPRLRDSHKGDYGNVGVIGGGSGMVGAPLLAARAALRMGAGRVFVEFIAATAPQFDPLFPELMLRSVRSLDRLDAIVIGCGLGTDAAASAALEWALASKCAAVFDADALNLLARDAALRESLRQRPGASVLTPHPLEAARLLQTTAQEVQADRIGCAKRLAHETAAAVVLKGAGTVIALPDGRAWINPTGTPALATPGSGDVLGGMVGALLAQSFTPLDATLAAVWLHGAAADAFGGDVGLIAGDIAARAAACLAELRLEPSA
jgi:hydroxyethylthiazole kinase-like uncharacterized protein yjeF